MTFRRYDESVASQFKAAMFGQETLERPGAMIIKGNEDHDIQIVTTSPITTISTDEARELGNLLLHAAEIEDKLKKEKE